MGAGVENHQSVVLIPQREAVGNALDRVGEARPRLLDQRFRLPAFGDVGVDQNEAAAGYRVVADLDYPAVRARPLERRLAAGDCFIPP